jgi:glycosyltransferase involved in cell wall biosynthesis
MHPPLVSVLMTSYNREKYISDSIRSVLHSTYENFELIVVDDGSSDNTVQIARSFETNDKRVKVYVNPKNLGDYANRNMAASYAKGKYLKYLDSDDMIYRHGLEVFVTMMEEHPDVALGIGSISTQKREPFPIVIKAETAHRHHFFKDSYLNCGPSGVIIKNDVFKKLGGFSGKRMVGDVELWLKITSTFDVMILPPSLIYWRQHEDQEFFAGIRNGIYIQMELPMIEEALSEGRSNLTGKEKQIILNYYKKITARGIINIAIKKRKVKEAIRLTSQLRITAKDFFNAVFFIRKPL